MKPSMDEDDVEVIQGEKTQVKQESEETIKEDRDLKPRMARASSSRPNWLRSLSLGHRRPWQAILKEQDSNQGSYAPEEKEKAVQRKASLTGEEVKELADAFIARMHRRMWGQRKESVKQAPAVQRQEPVKPHPP